MNGADGPAVDKTPDFAKSIPASLAIDENTLVAYEMNGQPLPAFRRCAGTRHRPGSTGAWVGSSLRSRR